MSVQFEIPSLEARMAAHAHAQTQKFQENVDSWQRALSRGLPLQEGETVWFRVFWDAVHYNLSNEALNEAVKIYREKGYFVRPLYSSYTCDWDEVHQYTVFEMAKLDTANPRHTKLRRPFLSPAQGRQT